MRSGAWERSPGYALVLDPVLRALAGSSLGMIGHGALDKRVEQIARGFEMDITIGERRGDRSRAGRLPLDEVITRSDVLVVLCPLTEETRG